MPVTPLLLRRPAAATWTAHGATRALLLLQLYLTRHVHAVYPGDVGHDYLTVAREWTHGRVPYVDFRYEYPPGTLPLVKFAWIAGRHTPLGFLMTWVAMMLVLDLAVVVLLRRWRPDDPLPALCWIVGVAAFGTSAFLRNDLQVVVCTLAAVAAFAARRPLCSGLAWGAGIVTKLWPAVPFLALLAVWKGHRVRLASGAAVVVGGVAIVQLATAAGPATVSSLRATQGNRPIELEATWALPTLARALIRNHDPHVFFSFGSFNVPPVRPWVPDVAYVLSAVVAVAALLTPAALLVLRRRRPNVTVLVWTFLAYTVAQIVVAPVLSAQYVLWALGAVCAVLCVERTRCALIAAALVVASCGLTQLVYPWLFNDLRAGDAGAVVVLTVRDGVLVAAAVVAGSGLVGAVRRDDVAQARSPETVTA